MGELRFPCVQFLKLQNSEKVNQIPCPRDWESRFVFAKWKACSFSILLSPPPLNTSIWVVLCHYLLLNIKFIRFCDCTLWIDHTWCNHFLYWRPHFLPLFMKMGWKCKSVLGFLVICFYIFAWNDWATGCLDFKVLKHILKLLSRKCFTNFEFSADVVNS